MYVPGTKSPDEPFYRISVAEAKELIDSGAAQAIDVREPGEWAADHIAQASLHPLKTILANAPKLLSGTSIVFVCEMGARSAVASEMAAAVGIENVYNMEGGMNAWRAAGFPVAK
jgi:rhodanese-related sulfurtransferase